MDRFTIEAVFANSPDFFEKGLDIFSGVIYNGKAVKNAAIAQSVERILGKDEVASSNLASSSKDTPKFRLRSFSFRAPQELATSSAFAEGKFQS